MTVWIYCKSHRRQPLRFGARSPIGDRQADIPAGWCVRCASEVFSPGEDLCPRCRNGKGESR